MAERASRSTSDARLRDMVGRLQAMGILTVTADATLTDAHDVIEVDTTGGGVTLTIRPTAAEAKGHIYWINQHTGANNVTLDANGSEEIDGATTQVFTGRRAYYSDGTAWRRLI